MYLVDDGSQFPSRIFQVICQIYDIENCTLVSTIPIRTDRKNDTLRKSHICTFSMIPTTNETGNSTYKYLSTTKTSVNRSMGTMSYELVLFRPSPEFQRTTFTRERSSHPKMNYTTTYVPCKTLSLSHRTSWVFIEPVKITSYDSSIHLVSHKLQVWYYRYINGEVYKRNN